MTTLIRNCRLISPGCDIEGASIAIAGRTIDRIYAPGDALPAEADTVDAKGQMVLPGFIDIHTHGAQGHDFSHGTTEAVEAVCRTKVKEGVTTLLPTTLTLASERLMAAVRAVAAYAAEPRYAKTPGMHLEGPYINADFIGAQNPDAVRNPDIDEVRALHEVMPVAIVSLAIELDGAVPMIRELDRMGIAPSAAHSGATYDHFKAARAAGLRHLTHYCNQMSKLHHREIGLVGAGLMDDEILLEMICDQIHLCPDMIRLVFKLKSVEQLALITDSVLASWMADGDYDLGGVAIRVKNGVARLVSNDALAGSTLRINHALRNVHAITGLPLSELVRTTSWNQAQSLGLEGLGRIEAGYAADLVMLDDAFEPVMVMVDGRPQDLN